MILIVAASPADGWTRLPEATPKTVVLHQAGVADDARRIATMVAERRVIARELFEDPAVTKEVDAVTLTVRVYAVPAKRANEGTATLETKGLEANLHLLAPSKHSSNARTSVGEPKDENYFERLIAHEVYTIALQALFRTKDKGWTFYRAPRWFYQGIQEYLALTRSNEHARTVTLAKYRAAAKADPRRHDSAYVGGALKIAYFVERYGWKKLVRLMKSDKPTFGRAFHAVTGINVAPFESDARVR